MFTHQCLEGTYLCLTISFSTWKCKRKLSKGFEVLSYAEVPAEKGVLSWGRKVVGGTSECKEEHECKEAETEDMSFHPLSFPCAKSLIESSGGICLGMPGRLLAWSALSEASLSASSVGLRCTWWAHTCQGWKLGVKDGRDQAEEALLTSLVLLCTGGNAAATKTWIVSGGTRYLHISPFCTRYHQLRNPPQPQGAKRLLQAKKTLKIHGIQCTLSRLDCLHLYPFPWLYVLSLTGWLHSADTLQHCSGLPHPDFTQKGLLSFHWLLAQLGN